MTCTISSSFLVQYGCIQGLEQGFGAVVLEDQSERVLKLRFAWIRGFIPIFFPKPWVSMWASKIKRVISKYFWGWDRVFSELWEPI